MFDDPNDLSHIGRRIVKAMMELKARDYESTVLHPFPALDSTAKRRERRLGIFRETKKGKTDRFAGERIKSFLKRNEDIISYIATNNIIKNISYDDSGKIA